MKRLFIICALMAMPALRMMAEVDPNFYIYICFGQSNMEGNAQPESVDKTNIDKRFQLLATCKFDNPSRTKGNWYKAIPPLVSPNGGLGPTDYFGRTMVAALPSDVRIGVIPVAMGGSPIEMFDKDKYQDKLNQNPNEWWATLAKNHYGGNPYGRIIEMAKKAQEVGVIKGILLHQGCSNCGDANWPNMVKKIYNDMLSDLNLGADSVPLFVGETEREDMGGGCSYHNTVVAKIPQVIPTGHVISSEGLPGNGTDAWHFSAFGYRLLGTRYAQAALKELGREFKADSAYQMSAVLKNLLVPQTIAYDSLMVITPKKTATISVVGTYADGRQEDLASQITFTKDNSSFTLAKGKIYGKTDNQGCVLTSQFVDFSGAEHPIRIVVVCTKNADNVESLLAGVDMPQLTSGSSKPEYYDLEGRRVVCPSRGMYVVKTQKGSKLVVR